jgi:hypothetical protein
MSMENITHEVSVLGNKYKIIGPEVPEQILDIVKKIGVNIYQGWKVCPIYCELSIGIIEIARGEIVNGISNLAIKSFVTKMSEHVASHDSVEEWTRKYSEKDLRVFITCPQDGVGSMFIVEEIPVLN